MIERTLRWSAVVIAVLAFIDPQITMSGHARPRLGIATTGGVASAVDIQGALRRELRDQFDIVTGLDPSAKAIVVVGDRYPDEPVAQTANVSTVSVDEAESPPVFVSHVSAPAAIPPATSVRIGVDVTATRSRGTTSELSIRTAGAEVAHQSHTWSSDIEVWHFDQDLVPIGGAPFVFEIGVGRSQATVAIDSAPRLRVLVVESRPSWATAFVRRALEDDARFEISGFSAVSPRASVKSGAAPSIPDDLRAFDAILVGGLDRTPIGDQEKLERFVQDRGGVVILVPDAAIPYELWRRFIPGASLHETLLERSSPLDATGAPTLEASELLEATALPAAAEVIARARSSRQPVIWSVPSGDGRIVVSGAMDAWRFRGGDASTFDRFWRSVVAGAALAARPAVDVKLLPQRAAPGEHVRVEARVRTLEREQQGDQLAISARIGAAPLRLWPDPRVGTFSGSFIVDARPNATTQRVTATLGDGTSGFARIAIEPQQTRRSRVPLAWLSSTRGGIDVKPSDLDTLTEHLRRTIAAEVVVEPRHPLRSSWWFVPFAGCLSAEWWLRRRRGAR